MLTDDFEDLGFAAALDARWRAEVGLLGLLCPEPRARWGHIGADLGIDVPDFTGEDTNIIARALCVVCNEKISGDARRICCRLAKMELEENHMWDDDDNRPQISRSIWGPVQLAVLFSKSMSLENDEIWTLIVSQYGRMQRLPEIAKI